MTQPAAWHPDPLQRHEYRYWDGAQWTEHVADAGQVGRDPIDGGAPADTTAVDTTAADSTAADAAAPQSQQPSPAQPTSTAGQQHPPAQQQPPPQGTQPFAQAGVPAAQPTGPSGGAGGPNNSAALAAMIVGILALLVSWVPFIGLLGVLGGIVALILGIVGRNRAKVIVVGAGQALTGIITGVLAVLVGIASTLVPVLFLQGMAGDFEEVERCIDEGGDEQACFEEHAPFWGRFLEDMEGMEDLEPGDGTPG